MVGFAVLVRDRIANAVLVRDRIANAVLVWGVDDVGLVRILGQVVDRNVVLVYIDRERLFEIVDTG